MNGNTQNNSENMDGILLGIGNPLLDMSAHVTQEWLTKYQLQPANAILAEASHLPLYQEMLDKLEVDYIAGGATQNSIRVAQWMLRRPNSTNYIGCIGQDKFGEQLKKAATSGGMNVHYLEDAKEPTGTAAILVLNKERTIVANLGAANHYKLEHLLSDQIRPVWESAKFFYIAGFFLTVSPPSIMHIARHAAETNKYFMMNLSAPFLVHFVAGPMWEAFPYVDFLFGNESEAKTVAEAQGMKVPEDPLERNALVARTLANAPKVNMKRPRVVVLTCGKKPTTVAVQNADGVQTFDTPLLPQDKIIDLNGAGDAFVGGFLAQLVHGRELSECVRAGNFAAQTIIQRSGCNVPDTCDFA